GRCPCGGEVRLVAVGRYRIDGKCGDKSPAPRRIRRSGRRPGIVVAADARPLARAEHGAPGPVGGGGAGQVGQVRLLPLARLVVFPGRGRVGALRPPAVPAGRDGGGFRIALVDRPAAGAAFRIGAALVVDVAELVRADALALAPGAEARAERLAVPPGEELREKGLHRFLRLSG